MEVDGSMADAEKMWMIHLVLLSPVN